jgi:ABC-type Fe3+-citrate transport system substrate-binding protein
MAYKCVGKDKEADGKLSELIDKMGAHEEKIEKYYDHCLAINALKASIFQFNSNIYMD